MKRIQMVMRVARMRLSRFLRVLTFEIRVFKPGIWLAA